MKSFVLGIVLIAVLSAASVADAHGFGFAFGRPVVVNQGFGINRGFGLQRSVFVNRGFGVSVFGSRNFAGRNVFINRGFGTRLAQDRFGNVFAVDAFGNVSGIRNRGFGGFGFQSFGGCR